MKFAVLPAAGKSTRMGRPKLALPIGERTILEHVLDALRQAEVEHLLVVVGPHVSELTPLARAAGAHVHQLHEETPDMRATVERGLRWLEDRFSPHDDDGWLLIPPDHPFVLPSVIEELERARRMGPERSIFVPTFQGRRGHPLALTWRHVAGIRRHPSPEGLNTYVRKQAAQVREVLVESESILWDLDTPEDYERLRRLWPLQK
jgi:molybdenum cofactor cytidylyltransferase